VKYWEIIADNLSKAGWSWGWVSAIDSQERTIWIVDAHRDGKRFICSSLVPPGVPLVAPISDGNNDDGGDGNTLDARATVLRNTHSRVTGSNTRRDNTRIRNGDCRS
jgi:hypothetical protein